VEDSLKAIISTHSGGVGFNQKETDHFLNYLDFYAKNLFQSWLSRPGRCVEEYVGLYMIVWEKTR
jgi:hypothetical protein